MGSIGTSCPAPGGRAGVSGVPGTDPGRARVRPEARASPTFPSVAEAWSPDHTGPVGYREL